MLLLAKRKGPETCRPIRCAADSGLPNPTRRLPFVACARGRLPASRCAAWPCRHKRARAWSAGALAHGVRVAGRQGFSRIDVYWDVCPLCLQFTFELSPFLGHFCFSDDCSFAARDLSCFAELDELVLPVESVELDEDWLDVDGLDVDGVEADWSDGAFCA
jgi:hypothetical protein